MYTYTEYMNNDGADLFTVVSLPDNKNKYPTVIFRSPYVDDEETMSEEEICAKKENDYGQWVKGGYAVVMQHCRGRGKSTGDCIPYIYEREDGLALHDWIRKQPFYNGELYLCGASYTASVHFVTEPFAEDIKGAIFEVKDCERYNCNFRNGFYKMCLHGGWYVNMYKKKSNLKKNYTVDSYKMLPLIDFSKTVFGERAEDFDEILRHPNQNDDFWNTRFGGGEGRNAIRNATIPILLVTGFYDTFLGGGFDMWRSMSDETRSKSVLAVHAFEHSQTASNQPILFENGALKDQFKGYLVRWFDSIRKKCDSPFETGKVTYYKLFGDKWCADDFYDANDTRRFTLGQDSVTYTYNPYAPATFRCGLSCTFGGTAWQYDPNSRYDIISVYTPEFEEDTFIKGKMKAKLKVRSDCEDTCFYVRLSLCKEQGDYGLRDDINQISNFTQTYTPNDEIEMTFTFDEHAFVVQKGEKIRIDISSSAWPLYVPHTNQKGLFCVQETAKIARNTVVLSDSYIEIPIKRNV